MKDNLTFDERVLNRYNRKIEGIITDERINRGNKALLKDFNIYLNNYTSSIFTRYIYLQLLRDFLLKTKFELLEVTSKDLLSFCADLNNKEKFSIRTINSYKLSLSCFYKSINKPEVVEVLKQQKPKQKEMELLTVQDILNMIKIAENLRDKAVIFTLYESGARRQEFLKMTLGSVKFDNYGALLTIPQGKTTKRVVRITDCVNDLKKWVESNPYKNRDDPLWINQGTHQNKPMGLEALRGIIVKYGNRLKIDKRKLYPHNFRHLRATILSEILNEMQLRVYFGWSRTSNMPSVYLHHNEDSVNSTILHAKGIFDEEDKTIVKKSALTNPLECPRCHNKNSITSMYCEQCWQPLTGESIKEQENKEQKIEELYKMLKIFERFYDENKDLFAEKLKDKVSNS